MWVSDIRAPLPPFLVDARKVHPFHIRCVHEPTGISIDVVRFPCDPIPRFLTQPASIGMITFWKHAASTHGLDGKGGLRSCAIAALCNAVANEKDSLDSNVRAFCDLYVRTNIRLCALTDQGVQERDKWPWELMVVVERAAPYRNFCAGFVKEHEWYRMLWAVSDGTLPPPRRSPLREVLRRHVIRDAWLLLLK